MNPNPSSHAPVMPSSLAPMGSVGSVLSGLGLPPAASHPAPQTLSARLPPSAPAAARTVWRVLERLEHGTLTVQWPDGSFSRVGAASSHSPGPHASLSIRDWSVFGAVLKSGDIGLAEAYIAGHWHSADVPGLLRFMLHHRQTLETLIFGRWWGVLLHRWQHWRNRNSREGSRRNIQAHYDLGNAFYQLWLDETMNYSSAWFDGQPQRSLAEAQHAKVGRALQATQVQPGQRVLEIGCGWGAVAEAAARAGVHLTGVTLSVEQLAWAQERLHRQGLGTQADLRLQDYRDIQDEPFDAVVSVEMFEAVGRAYWPTYFETVARCLKPGGRACIQSITIRDDLFDRYVQSTDFIQQYIFPGGLLPSDREFRRAAQAAGLVVEEAMAFGPDYAETLRRWRAAFHTQAWAVRALGFDEAFMRTWDFYLAYCEAAFDAGNTSVVQYTLRRA